MFVMPNQILKMKATEILRECFFLNVQNTVLKGFCGVFKRCKLSNWCWSSSGSHTNKKRFVTKTNLVPDHLAQVTLP